MYVCMYVCTSGTPYLDTVIMVTCLLFHTWVKMELLQVLCVYSPIFMTRYILLMRSMSAAGLLALHLNILYYYTNMF